ncbi:MAG TPA: Tim44 domain-containing protein, partial [Syntrophorhabdales bacterium]|nr:Tim44 domain-containing protein [Syntrophorhabdales bacterium]
EADSSARVGGGGSFGSRGSRTYSLPGGPSGPSRSYQPPSQAPSGPFGGGGSFRSLAGGIIGGMIGGMLFRSFGLGYGGWGGGGIGLFDILLIAVILYTVYRFVTRRQRAASEAAFYEASPMDTPSYHPSLESSHNPALEGADLQTGLRHIRQIDPSFDEAAFRDGCMDSFFKIQGSWANRDMLPVRSLLTDDMYGSIENDAEALKGARQINKLDNIAVRSIDIVEAWQEPGRDYVTVRFYANLLDYTVDEATGQVVSGSKNDPVKFEEYWTFARPIGERSWQLSAVTQPQ